MILDYCIFVCPLSRLEINHEDDLLFSRGRDKITEIRLSNIRRNIGYIIEWFPHLRKIRTHGILYSELFKGLEFPKCITFDGSMSGLAYLPKLSKVAHLICYKNKIPEIPECNYLDCRNNYIERLHPSPNLKYLYAIGNRIMNDIVVDNHLYMVIDPPSQK